MAETPEVLQIDTNAISCPSENHINSQTTVDGDRIETAVIHVEQPPMPPTPRCSTVESPTSSDQGRSTGARDEISCMAAAEIIAGMRGHDDPEGVWPELGCGSSRKCMVKNMAIFQIMDQ